MYSVSYTHLDVYKRQVIGLPSNLFTNTGIPVCILVFKKNRVNKDILFIDAQKDFVKDKSKNIMTSEHVLKVIDTYNNRSDIEKYSRKVSISEIEENDYNLNIPRYIDSFEPEEIPDAVRLAKELNEINRESRTLGLEIAEMLKQLVCTDPDAKKEHCLLYTSDSTQAEDIWLNELLIDMFDDKSIVKVNAIVKSKEKTALMMRHVNNMLDIYAEKCSAKRFKYCECMRRYYIDGETLEEIAESFPEKPDVRTIHRYIARGIEELSVLLWGVIGLNTKLS